MITTQDIIAKVDASKEEALQLLVEALESPSPTGSELPMAVTMKRWLDKLDLPVETYEYEQDRPNYIVEWKGSQEGKAFLFNGHMDVFPATESTDPTYDAWKARVTEDRVYGRGSSDMKGGDCAAYMAVKLLKEMGFDPKGSVVLNYVIDEESGGAKGILSLLDEGRIHADFGISMEPSCVDEEQHIELMVGHGGIYPCRIVVYGDGGHANAPIRSDDPDNIYGGEDAIKKSVKALKALYALQERISRKPKTKYGQSHLAITKINAGIAVNNYARRCEICVDRRYMPDETPETVDAEFIEALEAVKAEDPTFTYEFHSHYEPPTPVFVNDEDSAIVRAIEGASEEICGRRPEHITVVGGCDPAYIKDRIGGDYPWFGPGNFHIACSDEHVLIRNYLDCIKVYMSTIVRMLG